MAADRRWARLAADQEWARLAADPGWKRVASDAPWQSTPAASFLLNMQQFLDTVEAVTEFTIIPEFSLLPPFAAIQRFKNLPDFLVLPAFLALTSQSPASGSAQIPDMKVVHAVKDFVSFANEARERSRSSSDALTYACQNWAMHLSMASKPWDSKLNHIFKVFWDDHLLSWLERQWCLGGLRSCLAVLSQAQKLAKEYLPVRDSSQSSSIDITMQVATVTSAYNSHGNHISGGRAG